MNESTMTNVLTTQRRRCCSFDSPGLASVASYPGLMYCVEHNAIGVALFYFHFFKRRVGAEDVCRLTNPIAFCF